MDYGPGSPGWGLGFCGMWNPRVFADDARGWQCPFVLCLHPQGCLLSCSQSDRPLVELSVEPAGFSGFPAFPAHLRMRPVSRGNSSQLPEFTQTQVIESVMPSSYLILCYPLFLLPPILPSLRVFSNESTLHMRWPKYWSFSFSISPSNEHPGLGKTRRFHTQLNKWPVTL